MALIIHGMVLEHYSLSETSNVIQNRNCNPYYTRRLQLILGASFHWLDPAMCYGVARILTVSLKEAIELTWRANAGLADRSPRSSQAGNSSEIEIMIGIGRN